MAETVDADPAERTGTELRVLLVAPQPFYQDRGTPIAVAQVLRALSQIGHEVDVLTYPIGEPLDVPRVRILRAGNPLRLRRVPIGFSIRKLLLDASLTLALGRQLKRRRYDCVHAVEEAAFPAVVLARRQRIPVIYDMQSSLTQQMSKLSGLGNRLSRRLLRHCETWLLNRVDVVVSSSGLERRVRTLAPDARLQEWRYSPPEVAVTREETTALRAELGIAANAPVVVYSGTFEMYQGLARLLAAARFVLQDRPDVVFVLVGAEEHQIVPLLRSAEGVVPRRNLRVVARQPRHRIAQFLALGDILVSPRIYGGNIPLKVFDYLGAHRPIVATDIPTHRSLLDDDRAVLVGPDPAEMAAGIAALLEDPERAGRIADAAASYARTYLGWMVFVQSVSDLYAEAWELARSRRARD
jgi:glycosyltransferase involved in cell wall biosynthesis